jgi:hypothetical protein
LQNALFSVLLALRNHPDRYFIIDRMELTHLTIHTITNYGSFQESRRLPYLPGSEKLVYEMALEMAERIFCNLQKVMTDSSISTAAGLKEGSSYREAYQA